MVGNVKVVDALAPSRLNQGSLFDHGTTVTEAAEEENEVNYFGVVNVQ